MEKTFFKTLAIIFGMIMSFSVVSCGDDNDEPEKPGDVKAAVCYEVTYSVDLTPDYFTFFNITYSYLDAAGTVKTQTLTENKSFTVDIPTDVMPQTLNFTVHATIKNPLPSVAVDKEYRFEDGVQVKIQKKFKDNTTSWVIGDKAPVGMVIIRTGEGLLYIPPYEADKDLYNKTFKVK